MTDQEVQQLVGNLAPKRIAHATDPNDPLSGKASLIPYDGSDPKPGDQLEFVTDHGTYAFNVASDGSWQLAGEPKKPTVTRTKSGYPTADEIASDPLGAAKKRYQATLDDPASTPQDISAAHDALQKEQTASDKNGKVDDTTKALAQAAVLKTQAGQNPTQGELEAYFKVRGQQNTPASNAALPSTGSATLDWLQQQAKAGKTSGWQRFGEATPWDPNQKGQSVGVAKGSTVPLPTGTVTAVTPWGFGDYSVSVQQGDGTTITVGHIEKPDFKVGDQIGGNNTVTVRGDQSPISSGPHADVRVQNAQGDYIDPMQYVGASTLPHGYSSSGTGDLGPLGPAAAKPEIHALGNKLYQYDPNTKQWSVAVDASNLAAPTVHQIGNVLYQWDPGSKKWSQALVGPLSPTEQKAQQDVQGKVQTVLTQMQTTKDYIAQQLGSGTITPAEAQQYLGALNDYTSAALQGTTPYERWKFQQEQETMRATTAKDLLDTKMQESSRMATSLLSDSLSSLRDAKYGASAMAPGTLSGLFLGGLDAANQQAQPLADLAKQLLQPLAAQAAAKGLDPRIGQGQGPIDIAGTPPTGPQSGNPFDAASAGAQVPPGSALPPWLQQALVPSSGGEPLQEAA